MASNIEIVRSRLGSVRIIFVAKVDGYGHGLTEVSKMVEKADLDYLAVSNIMEVKQLREEGIDLPILIFGPIPNYESTIDEIVDLRATPTITSTNLEFVHALNQRSQLSGLITPIHLNVDTGMGRTGLKVNEVLPFVNKLKEFDSLQLEGIYSHLSVAGSAHSEDRRYTFDQINQFRRVLEELEGRNLLPPLRHISNSAGFLRYEGQVTKSPLNAVRMGTLFYGYPEVDRKWASELQPVMSLYTRVAETKKLPLGSYVGYGRNYRVGRDEIEVAVLPVGDGDGLSRKLSRGGTVVIHERRAPIVGGISANHTLVDVSDVRGVAVGDQVELAGSSLRVNETCQQVGASVLELLSPFACRGYERVYTGIDPE